MSKVIKYNGTVNRWPELAVTGKQAVWYKGQQEERTDLEANKLLATQLFTLISATPSAVPGFKRKVFIGDSRAQFGEPYRRPGVAADGAFDGRTVYVTSGTFNASTQWIAYGIIDGNAALNSQGIVSSDAAGLLSYAHAGDTSGPKVDVSNGGWYRLMSGTNGVGITVAVRGSSAKTLNAGGTYATSGFPLIWDYDPRGWTAAVAGMLRDTFSDYQSWAIPGASTADIVKYLPQVFETPAEAATICCGVNDIADAPTAPQALTQMQQAFDNFKLMIDYARVRVTKLYVTDIFQAPNKNAIAQQAIDKLSAAVRSYCRGLPNVRFVACNNQLVAYGATSCASKTGVYASDNLHYLAYGAYKAGLNLVTAILQDYPAERQFKNALDVWDATTQTGALNPNPTFLGTTGTGSGAGGVTGNVPTSWSATRSGATQTLALSSEAATDGGPDWLLLTAAGSTLNDFHNLSSSINPFPSGIAIGDYFRVFVDIKFGAMVTPGISLLYIACTGNTNLNNAAVLQLQPGWNIDTFTTENPVYGLFSEPQKLLDVTTPFTLRVRIGAAVGGSGTIGIRNFRVEKVAGPIYPQP